MGNGAQELIMRSTVVHKNAAANLGGVKRDKIEAGDDAKAVTTAFQGPEEIAVLCGGGSDDFTAGENDLLETMFSIGNKTLTYFDIKKLLLTHFICNDIVRCKSMLVGVERNTTSE